MNLRRRGRDFKWATLRGKEGRDEGVKDGYSGLCDFDDGDGAIYEEVVSLREDAMKWWLRWVEGVPFIAVLTSSVVGIRTVCA